MTAFSDETGRDWLPLKYEDGPDFCTVTLATGAAFALTVHPERMKLMEAALSAPVGEPVAWQFMASDDVVLSTTADKRVVKQWEQSGYHVRPLYTYPPAPAVGAEDVARATLSASPVAQEPVAWLRNLVGAECKPDGRCYDICFADPKDDRYRALYTSPPATPAGVGADEIARLVEDLKAASESLHLPPSIQSQRNIKAMNAMDRAAKIILALLSRAGDQSNSTHEA